MSSVRKLHLVSERLRIAVVVQVCYRRMAAGAPAEGRAESLSAWVNDALRRQTDHDRRMKALDGFVDAYESEHGEIPEEEMRVAARRARSRAVVVRTAPPVRGTGSRKRGTT